MKQKSREEWLDLRLHRRATANTTQSIPLRPNRVHPLWRTDHNNNVGIGAPEIEFGFEPEGKWIDLITVHKGGLFGTDYRMLFPSDGIEGIKRFYLDSLVAFGKRGLAAASNYRNRFRRFKGYMYGYR